MGADSCSCSPTTGIRRQPDPAVPAAAVPSSEIRDAPVRSTGVHGTATASSRVDRRPDASARTLLCERMVPVPMVLPRTFRHLQRGRRCARLERQPLRPPPPLRQEPRQSPPVLASFSSATGNFWRVGNPKYRHGSSGRGPMLPTGSGNQGNRLAAGNYYYGVSVVYKGKEGPIYIYGAGSQSTLAITGTPTALRADRRAAGPTRISGDRYHRIGYNLHEE